MAQARERADVEFFAEIAIIERLAAARLERALPAGLSSAQFGVLNHFARHGGASSPLALARVFQVTKGAMTNTLQRLEAQGFVEITDDADDGRRKRVEITAAGLAAQQAGLMAVRPRIEAIRAAFGAEDFNAALPFLKSLRAWLEEHR